MPPNDRSIPASADAPAQIALDRTKQVFRFVKAFAERNSPARCLLAQQPWVLRFADLPLHPTILLGVATHDGEETDEVAGESERDAPALLKVRRPTLTKPPVPPEELAERITFDPNDVDATPAPIEPRNPHFDSWIAKWEAWRTTEQPARAAAHVFDRLYDLKTRIELESERVELVVGDGHVHWQQAEGLIDHPVLLQRVELAFDPVVPEFRLLNSDRGPELFTAILHGADGRPIDRIVEIQRELETGGYHPLAVEGTTKFLKQLPVLLARNGSWSDEPPTVWPESAPAVCRDPVLFLRDRSSGLPAAIDRVLKHLEQSPQLPPSLTRLVGVEPPPPPPDDEQPAPPWSEPEDVLLSKPANAEQVQLARALERHRAVLVQGPPGTGKSHTIANLIGHLVAQGKRVLVTAQTTKALRVLRDRVVDTLQPLCVAVLDNDLEGRSQLEQAVRGIATRLSTAHEATLTAEIDHESATRTKLLAQIDELAMELAHARAGEYSAITFGEHEVPAAAAAAEVRRAGSTHNWLPGPLQRGAPFPLGREDIDALYATNGLLAPAEDHELGTPLPTFDDIPSPDEFTALVDDLAAEERPEQAACWSIAPRAESAELLARAADAIKSTLNELGAFDQWQACVAEAGYNGSSEADLWITLAKRVRDATEVLSEHREVLLEHAPEIRPDASRPQLEQTIGEIREHLATGHSLSRFTLIMTPSWRRAIAACRVNRAPPKSLAHFRAISGAIEVDRVRGDLGVRWDRQAAANGLPKFVDLADPPELTAAKWTEKFDRLLAWWNNDVALARHVLDQAGFKWKTWYERASGPASAASPFRRDAALLRDSLLPIVETRLRVARRAHSESRLTALAVYLKAFEGDVGMSLYKSAKKRDPAAYRAAFADFEALSRKRTIREQRDALLARLRLTAPGWASAIQWRDAPHDGARPPGDPVAAWRWRQLHEELDRRAKLDETAIARRLDAARSQLRRATAKLIDRKAWLAQIRRTDLQSRQALFGWLDTQRQIGKGTGKRVPELRAEARKLLAGASDAVPVWIMPLARVAESFDPARGIFDVVIVDEASQCDVTGLLAWYFGRQIAIVGDHEQVSPLDVGGTIASASSLINEHLAGIPNSHLYDGKTSIYDLARHSFGGVVGLREHFRCVPDIIDFSNYLSYDGEIRPLRNPSSAPMPHVSEIVVPAALATGRDDDKTNLAEARVVAALIKATSEDPLFDGKTLGAITLLGDQQAKLIHELAVSLVGAVELVSRRFAAGNAAQFQGDERDIIWLSMVDAPVGGRHRFSDTLAMKQRYNVAASRARDRLWLVHSLEPTRDLQPGDLRRRLIEHVRNPGAHRRALLGAHPRAESPFEAEVIRRLIAKGYRVAPQAEVGHYRIDIVVSDGLNQAAVECDGDRFHPIEQIPADMARQAVLERAGWQFVRVRGTRFYRDPDSVMDALCSSLTTLGVRPAGPARARTQREDDVRERLLQKVWETFLEQGWGGENR